MRLLVVGPDVRERHEVKNFTGVLAYYLGQELRRCGIELHFVEARHRDPLGYFQSIDAIGCDHVLALGLRYFTQQPVGCAAILKSKVPGAVTQIHDGLVHAALDEHMIGVDCTFMIRDDASRVKDWHRYADTNHYIGWAVDPTLLFPEQSRGELRILIDHPDYKTRPGDRTREVTEGALLFAANGEWQERYRSIRLRRIVDGGVENVERAAHSPFTRQHIPLEDIAAEYRMTSVFLVTHRESVGLTCLEAACAGALVVTPSGLIYPDRLDTIRHIGYDGVRAPWPTILSSIDVLASAARARRQSWALVTNRMLQWFEAHGR